MTSDQSAWVTVALVLRPHGRRGEVACEILTDFPEHLTRLRIVRLFQEGSLPRDVDVHACRLTQSRGGQAIFHFAGADSISEAEKLVGLEVQIPLADRMQLPSGTYYVTDLIGCIVVDGTGASIGIVAGVQFTGENIAGTAVLVVDSGREDVLIPLAQEICTTIDVAARRISVTPPEGLLGLNS